MTVMVVLMMKNGGGLDVSVYNPNGSSKMQRFDVLGDVDLEVSLEAVVCSDIPRSCFG